MKKIMNTIATYMVETLVVVVTMLIGTYAVFQILDGSATIYWMNFSLRWHSIYGCVPHWDWVVLMQDRYRLIAVGAIIVTVTSVVTKILHTWDQRVFMKK